MFSDEELIELIDFDDTEVEELNNFDTNSENVTIKVGMMFPDLEDIYKLYNEYAFTKGFGIKRRNIRDNYALFVCHRHGFNQAVKGSNIPESSRRLSSYQGTSCKAALHVYKEHKSTMWRITRFLDDHNHIPCSPNSVPLLKSHRHFSSAARSLTERLNYAGVPVGKAPTIFVMFGF